LEGHFCSCLIRKFLFGLLQIAGVTKAFI
jgi:hypothetical protein